MVKVNVLQKLFLFIGAKQ